MSLHRRELLVGGLAAAGGGLLIGCRRDAESGAQVTKARLDTPADIGATDVNAWVRIGTDGIITMIVSESEMGQGVLTSIPMIVADELEADWSRVRSEHAPVDAEKYGRQSTGGSTSIRQGFEPFRKAGAAAREMLVTAAATRWKVAASECRAENSFVIHPGSGRRLGYGELAAAAAQLPVPQEPKLKDRSDFKIIGRPQKRLDTAAKVKGEAKFGMDVQVTDMLTAVVAHPPAFGGKVDRFDPAAAKAVPGVREVVEIPSGVAVVADNFWAATKGRAALKVTWDGGPFATLTSEKITDLFRKSIDSGVDAQRLGDPTKVLKGASRKLEAVYEVPYLAHAPMEPMNCTADVRPDRCEL